jgi:hypothetical protein
MPLAYTFAEWLIRVDRIVQDQTGLGAEDLPDWNYREAYEQGVPPLTAAKRAIRAAKSF